jgi:Holliday junction resolvase-like predicted endonuclease
MFFWRSRTASEVDLVMKQGEALHAFEIKWRRQRVAMRAFRDAYSVSTQLLCALDPFLLEANQLLTP